MSDVIQSAPPTEAGLTGRPAIEYTDKALLNTRTVVLNEGDPEAKREEIRRYFHATFDIDEALLEGLRYEEAFYTRADPLRHPLIFYFGHTSVFFVNKLLLANLIDTRINPAFESMFAIGVDEMSWDDLNTAHYDWPTVQEVQDYRNTVRERIDECISTTPLSMPIQWDSPFWVIMMGIEHARIHLETSSVLIRQLPLDMVRPHPLFPPCASSGDAPRNTLIEVPSGLVRLGKQRNHALYGWDNEFGEFEADCPPFRASQYLVSNAEYREFVDDGGYHNDAWWTEEGWAWRQYEQAEHPRFWRREGDAFRQRNVFEERPMPWDWPAEMNQLEAKAFCNWMGARKGTHIRLPTEAEWYLIRDRCVTQDQPEWHVAPGNINLEHYGSSCPVTTFAFGNLYDVIGNVWQWTETPISGFRHFAVHPYYDDFSTPTFDAKHNLIKGGSWMSTGNEATRDSRYAFRRHFYQHAGLRYVESDAAVTVAMDVYEGDEMICQYCEFHYGETYFDVPNYPAACAEACLRLTEGMPRGRALDLGCAVGRTSFELARGYDSVLGLDFSANFIRMAIDMQERGFIKFERQEEGELVSFQERSAAEFGLEQVREKVEFLQGDACNLKSIYTGFDLIFAGNLIDRLYSPRRFLTTIHERLNPGGMLVLSSPYTWLTEFTEREEWIGGFRRDGEPWTTREALAEILAAHFEPVGEPQDIPFVIRETRRKFQHTVAELTAWRRK